MFNNNNNSMLIVCFVWLEIWACYKHFGNTEEIFIQISEVNASKFLENLE